MSSMTTFYFSFADGDLPTGEQFLGALFINASDIRAAVTQSHLTGLNPGGEIQTVELPADVVVPDKWFGRLLSREDIDEMDREMGAV